MHLWDRGKDSKLKEKSIPLFHEWKKTSGTQEKKARDIDERAQIGWQKCQPTLSFFTHFVIAIISEPHETRKTSKVDPVI